MGGSCSLAIEHLPTVYKALGPIPRTQQGKRCSVYVRLGDFIAKISTRDREGHYILTRPINQEHTAALHIDSPHKENIQTGEARAASAVDKEIDHYK